MARRKRRSRGLSGGNPDSIRTALKATCGITIGRGSCGDVIPSGWRIKQGGRVIGCEVYLSEAIETARLRCPRVALHRTRY